MSAIQGVSVLSAYEYSILSPEEKLKYGAVVGLDKYKFNDLSDSDREEYLKRRIDIIDKQVANGLEMYDSQQSFESDEEQEEYENEARYMPLDKFEFDNMTNDQKIRLLTVAPDNLKVLIRQSWKTPTYNNSRDAENYQTLEFFVKLLGYKLNSTHIDIMLGWSDRFKLKLIELIVEVKRGLINRNDIRALLNGGRIYTYKNKEEVIKLIINTVGDKLDANMLELIISQFYPPINGIDLLKSLGVDEKLIESGVELYLKHRKNKDLTK